MDNDTLSLAAQRAYSATVGRGATAIAVTGTSVDARSSQFARAIAAAGANFGRRVLLLNATTFMSGTGDFEACECEADVESVARLATRESERLSVLEVPKGTRLHAMLNDSRHLSKALSGWTGMYDAIVIDCPAYGAVSPPIYTPLTASAVDAVLLVGMPGTLPSQEFEAVCQWLGESGAELSALVLNDQANPTLGQEIIREARRLKRLWPGFTDFVTRQVGKYPLLNRHN